MCSVGFNWVYHVSWNCLICFVMFCDVLRLLSLLCLGWNPIETSLTKHAPIEPSRLAHEHSPLLFLKPIYTCFSYPMMVFSICNSTITLHRFIGNYGDFFRWKIWTSSWCSQFCTSVGSHLYSLWFLLHGHFDPWKSMEVQLLDRCPGPIPTLPAGYNWQPHRGVLPWRNLHESRENPMST